MRPVKAESLAGCPDIHRSSPYSTVIVFWIIQRRLRPNTTVYRQAANLTVMSTFHASNKRITSRFVQDKNEAAEDAVTKLSLQDHVIVETYANLPWVK